MLILHHVLTFDELVDEGFKMKLLFEDASVETLWVMGMGGVFASSRSFEKVNFGIGFRQDYINTDFEVVHYSWLMIANRNKFFVFHTVSEREKHSQFLQIKRRCAEFVYLLW